ncbi:helix-turn-helix domain-containing protein [Paracoccus marcusii]|uniref:helix-turn-helix domain-containing protein n=1 Tax=Paracoccus marcusii TaxID=59779 RepID=UPI0024919090|nr:helix-turn-helix transcriptional regulator [Paracoccus marcusii]
MQTLHAPPAASIAPHPALSGAARLQAHIAKAGITQAAFATRVSVSKGYITELLNGTKRPSLSLAVRIETESRAAVPASSWIMSDPAEMLIGRHK